MNGRINKSLLIVSATTLVTSCSLFSHSIYNWKKATNNNTNINYCLLIGQNEHSDSIERTRYTREALGTRNKDSEINGNANLGYPKQGKLTLGEGDYQKEFTVNELEHMEQKSLAGVTWDAITANGTTATWICKHGSNITMFISNNDGMAEGCLMASNYIQGLPIFGYDANTSTLRKIKNGSIMGTVDQNASTQTSTAYLLIRNILEDIEYGTNNIGTTSYNPLNRGFNGLYSMTDYGFYIDGFDYEDKKVDKLGIVNPFEDKENMKLDGNGAHEILTTSIAIDGNNISDYINDKDEILTPKDLAWDDKKGFAHTSSLYYKPKKSYKVCHVYNNIAETYLQGIMHDYYIQYAGDDSSTKGNVLNLDITKIDGDGVDETAIFNKVSSSAKNVNFDAFLINMVTTTDGGTFVSNLASIAGKKENKNVPQGGWDKFEDRLNTPLIFWNKQPQTIKGEKDVETMNNKYFKYTYYVGVDAAYGGKVQGKMIVNYLDQQYRKSINK